jgi:hypothetical protein
MRKCSLDSSRLTRSWLVEFFEQGAAGDAKRPSGRNGAARCRSFTRLLAAPPSAPPAVAGRSTRSPAVCCLSLSYETENSVHASPTRRTRVTLVRGRVRRERAPWCTDALPRQAHAMRSMPMSGSSASGSGVARGSSAGVAASEERR